MHWYWQNVGKDNYKLCFVSFQLSYGPWLMSEFYFHLISWEQIDGFWWNFDEVSIDLWPLTDVKISIFRNNDWILIKFCLCIDIWMLWMAGCHVVLGPSLKFCKFAVPRPTRENRRDPNFFIAISDFFFFFFFGGRNDCKPDSDSVRCG